MDDDDDDDDDNLPDDDDDEPMEQWKGTLGLNKQGMLEYTGKSTTSLEQYSFSLRTTNSISWNWNSPTENSRMRTLALVGTVGNVSSVTVDMTITAAGEIRSNGGLKSSNDDGKKRVAGKSTGEEDDDDGGGGKQKAAGKSTGEDDDGKKKAVSKTTGEDDDGKKQASSSGAAPNSQVLTVFGRGPGWEIYGEFTTPTDTTTNDVELTCRYQPVAAAAGASAGTAAAAKVVDDDDEDVDVDEGVDYNELIALHEDAGMPMGEVRKRFRSGTAAAAAANQEDAKRTKTVSDDDDDDDDDIGF
jgi:hypothetical protein